MLYVSTFSAEALCFGKVRVAQGILIAGVHLELLLPGRL